MTDPKKKRRYVKHAVRPSNATKAPVPCPKCFAPCHMTTDGWACIRHGLQEDPK